MKITITLAFPVKYAPGKYADHVDLNYIYVDTDHLDLYTSIGQVRAAYPGSEESPIQFSEEDMLEPAITFIKTIIPARIKAWAESLGAQE